MMDESSAAYYRAREEKERALAEAATSPMIAGIHRDMARRYAELTGNQASSVGYHSITLERASKLTMVSNPTG